VFRLVGKSCAFPPMLLPFLCVCTANSELPSYDLVVPALLEVGIDGLKEKCQLTPGLFSKLPF
jgi:hypothetical protein